MARQHAHGPTDYNRAFGIGVALNVAYVLVEAGVGFGINSLALLADAGHNLSDVLGLLLAWAAHRLSHRRPSGRFTYGLRSSTILAALANALILLVAIGGIGWEAIRRFTEPASVPGSTVIWVAAVGVAVNTATAVLFLKGRREDLNVHGAFLHMAADAGVSVGVVVAGIGMMTLHWSWIDPATSLVVAAVILFSTWSLFVDSLRLMLHAVPRNLDLDAIREHLVSQPDVEAVHDLHVWAMSTTETALTAHVVRGDGAPIDDRLPIRLAQELQDRFGIAHTTIQVEPAEHADECPRAPEDVV